MTTFTPPASFKAKCAAKTAQTKQLDQELNSLVSEMLNKPNADLGKAVDSLSKEIAFVVEKLSRIEKLNIVKRVVA